MNFRLNFKTLILLKLLAKPYPLKRLYRILKKK